MADAPTWLTPEAFDRLSAELNELTTTGRSEVVKRIETARAEGDLRENGGYHAAREEQAKMEGHIAQLKAILDNAQVGQAPAEASQVGPGTVVSATMDGRPMKFLIGSREVAATTDLDVYSDRSPLGAAILGAAAGETRTYTAPNGKQFSVTVNGVEPYVG